MQHAEGRGGGHAGAVHPHAGTVLDEGMGGAMWWELGHRVGMQTVDASHIIMVMDTLEQ